MYYVKRFFVERIKHLLGGLYRSKPHASNEEGDKTGAMVSICSTASSSSIVTTTTPMLLLQDDDTLSSSSSPTLDKKQQTVAIIHPSTTPFYTYGIDDQYELAQRVAALLMERFYHTKYLTSRHNKVLDLPQYLFKVMVHTNQCFREHQSIRSIGARCLIMGYMYYERKCYKSNYTTPFSSLHHEILACMMLAVKMTEDQHAWNRCAKITENMFEITRLEHVLLVTLQYEMHITAEDYAERFQELTGGVEFEPMDCI